MKKKPKPKAKAKTIPLKAPLVLDPEKLTAASGKRLELRVAFESMGPDQGAIINVLLQRAVKSYEKTTGAKANQTRLIDFVRWCEDNSGLL